MIRKTGGLLSLVAIVFLFLIALFTYRDVGDSTGGINIVQVAVSSFIGVFILVVISLYKIWQSKIKKYVPLLFIIVGIIGQIIFIITFKLPLMTDVAYVFTQAERLAGNNYNWFHYYFVYPNNVNVTLLWASIFKVFNFLGIQNHILVGRLLQVLLFDLSVYGLSMSLKNKFAKLYKWVMVVMILYVPFTMMAMFLYNDIFALIIFNLTIACLVNSLEDNITSKKRVAWLAFMALLLALGVGLRSNLGIIVIAAGITILISKKFDWKLKSFFIVVSILFLGIVSMAFSISASHNSYEKKAQESTPTITWINMSWNPNTYGQIDGNDAWSWSELPKDERSKQVTEEFKNRISNYSFAGIVKHIVKKVSFMYATGFVHQDFTELYQMNNYPIWKKFQLFSKLIFQPMYVLLLVSGAFAIFKMLKTRQNETLILFLGISILGTIMFHGLLWEVRDRYAVITLPAIVMLGIIGISDITDRILVTKNMVTRWMIFGFGLFFGLMGLLIGGLNKQGVLPKETVMSEGYFPYANGNEGGKSDFKLEPFMTYKVSMRLDHKAKDFQYSTGWISDKNSKKLDIKLVNKTTNRSYVGTTQPNNNSIQGNFKPGKYEFVVKTGNITPTKTYLFTDVGTEAWHTNKVMKNNKQLIGVIPYFKFTQ